MRLLTDKINSKIDRMSVVKGDCKIWIGMVDSMGYAKAKLTPHWTKGGRVSRMILLIKLGRIPMKSEWACHICDNPLCVNINHIYVGDAKSNNLDTVRRFRRRDRKIDDCTKDLMINEYLAGKTTQQVLGLQYGVSQVRVSQIVRSTRRADELER